MPTSIKDPMSNAMTSPVNHSAIDIGEDFAKLHAA
jgi:hypothetical protein